MIELTAEAVIEAQRARIATLTLEAVQLTAALTMLQEQARNDEETDA